MDQKKFEIACHETGHAVMALMCSQKIKKISLSEMDSPNGTDKYLAYMMLETSDPNTKFTFEKGIQKVMISLGGFASEILFLGFTNLRGDDLAIAVKTTQDMFQVEEFKIEVAKLPIPKPGPLDMIENPLARAYIDYAMSVCVNRLEPKKALIQKIAEELYRKGELSGNEVHAFYNSYVQSSMKEK